MKQLLLMIAVVALVGCGSPKGINQTSKVKIGTPIWEFQTGTSRFGSGVGSSPAIGSDGTVYVGSNDKKLYAINGKSGVKLWEFETGGTVYSSPAIGSDGTVYVGSLDKKLYAIKTDSKGLAKSPWPMRGQNARHTGRTK
jgi:outer membrane protein assembly factor BamB